MAPLKIDSITSYLLIRKDERIAITRSEKTGEFELMLEFASGYGSWNCDPSIMSEPIIITDNRVNDFLNIFNELRSK